MNAPNLAPFVLCGIWLAPPALAQVQVDPYPLGPTSASTREVPSHLNFDGSVLAGLDESADLAGELVVWARGAAPQTILQRYRNAFGLMQGAIGGISDDGSMVHVDSYDLWWSQSARWTEANGLEPYERFASGEDAYPLELSPDGTAAVGIKAGGGIVEWRNGLLPSLVCPGGPACAISVSSVSGDGTAIAGQALENGVPAVVYWSQPTGKITLSVGNTFGAHVVAVSDDGATVLLMTPTRRLARWTSATGLVDLGMLPGATTAQHLYTNADCTRAFVEANVPGANGLRRGVAMWDSQLGWSNFADYLEAQGATGYGTDNTELRIRAASGNGKAVILLRSNPTVSGFWLTEVVYFDGAAPGPFIGTQSCIQEKPGPFDLPAHTAAQGSTLLADDDVTLIARHLPPAQFAMALCSQGLGLMPPPAGATGNICLGAGMQVGRFNRPGELQVASGTGYAQFPLDLSSFPIFPSSAAPAAGETWHFQVWARGTASTNFTSAFSSAVSLTFR